MDNQSPPVEQPKQSRDDDPIGPKENQKDSLIDMRQVGLLLDKKGDIATLILASQKQKHETLSLVKRREEWRSTQAGSSMERRRHPRSK